MKVKDLIAELQRFDSDESVSIGGHVSDFDVTFENGGAKERVFFSFTHPDSELLEKSEEDVEAMKGKMDNQATELAGVLESMEKMPYECKEFCAAIAKITDVKEALED